MDTVQPALEHFEPAPSESAFPSIPAAYALARLSEAVWASGPHPGLQSRDLLLSQASDGQMGALQFQATRAGSVPRWLATSPTFGFIYVTSGTLMFQAPGGEALTLRAGDAAIQEAVVQDWPVQWSEDLNLVEITAGPRGAERVRSPECLLDFAPPGQVASLAAVQHLVNRDIPENFQAGSGLRSFLAYRDFGPMAATERRVHIHQIDAVETPEGGTGWHVHSMSQLFYVTRGWVDIAVEGQGSIHMVAGDAMCIGHDTRHNVHRFSTDYSLIELCLPGDYSTVVRPAPAAAAA